jgi:acetylornithine deacetylase/succinyl-diaminopimelate desuccinylase-like protein
MNRVRQIAEKTRVQAALVDLQKRVEEIVDYAIKVQQIPSPTFAEARRARYVEEQFYQLGLDHVEQDALHNVYGRYPGHEGVAPVVVTAHSDTVFAAETDLAVQRQNGRVYGPGIADNALGVASLLVLGETLNNFSLRPSRDIWFVANVGEEGLGDLRGMRAVVDRFGEAATYLVLEGGLYGYVCHEGIAVRRFRIDVHAPGGHSWGSFGTPSAIHVLGRLIVAIDRLNVPQEPKTTYNVGVVEGGTTVNSIAQKAQLLLDLRSESHVALEKLVKQVERLVATANAADDVSVSMQMIGNRPAGRLGRDTELVSWAVASLQQVGCGNIEYTVGSTDANVPLSRQLPAVCVGITRSGNTHRPDEYMEVEPIPSGLGQALLLLLAAAGF